LTCSHIRPVLPLKDGSAPTVILDDVGHARDPPEPEADAEGTGTGEDAYGWYIPPAPLLKEHDDETSAPAAVQTLRMDGCGLRPAVLETLGESESRRCSLVYESTLDSILTRLAAQGIRSSDLKNISLRRNRIGPLGAVALALMIRDYPDSALTMSSLTPALSTTPSMHNPSIPNLDSSSPNAGYVPYAARSRRPVSEALAAAAAAKDDDSSLPPIPLVVSSATGGVTSRTLPEGYKPPPPPKNPLVMPSGGNSAMQDSSVFGAHVTAAQAEGKVFSPGEGASVALQRSVRALDRVERIGRLLTLDLKGNDIKVSQDDRREETTPRR
jgi:protein phosphatase 1 regulatory subunit 37